MPVDTPHDEYTEFLPDWRTMRDVSSGERRIKSKNDTYLPIPTGYEDDYNAGVTSLYDKYKARATFPEWIAAAARSMVGIAFDSPPVLEVPQGLEGIEESATRIGEPLEVLAKRVVLEALLAGRYGLIADIADSNTPYIATYKAEKIINWRTNRVTPEGLYRLSLVVLEEEYIKNDEDYFDPEWEVEYHELYLNEAGNFVRQMWRPLGDSGKYERYEEPILPSTITGMPLDVIPFVVAGSTDIAPSCDQIPLLQMARSSLKYYQLSADYYQSIYMTSNPTPVVSGADDESIKDIGSSTLWAIPTDAKAYFLEVSGSGITTTRTAMMDTYQSALEAGAKVTDNTLDAESGVARRARQRDQQATLRSVVIASCAAIEQVIKFHALFLGLNPDDVSYTPSLDFSSHDIDAALITALNTGVVSSTVPRSVLWEALREGGLTGKSDEIIEAEIEDDRSAGINISAEGALEEDDEDIEGDDA